MNILIICKKFPFPLKDGETIAIMNMIRGYFKLGHEVTVVAINTSKHHFDMKLLPPHISMMARFYPIDVNTDVSKAEAFKNLFSRKSYNIERFNSKAVHSRLKEVLSDKDFDMVQLEGLYLVPYINTIRAYTKAPIAMRAHNMEYEIWEGLAKNESGLQGWYLKILANKMKRFERSSLNKYDALVPVTESDAKQFKSLGSNTPLYIAPIGMDVSNMKPAINNRSIKTLFHLGSLDWLPNQEGLVWFLDHVWSELIAEFPNLQFNIAGRNIPEWFEKLSYNNVNILGEVEHAHQFVLENDLMIVPLFSGSGMRVKIMEAMALGKTVVSTTLGAEGSFASNGDNILIANTADEFVNNIIDLIQNENKYHNIGFAARQHILKHFDSNKIASDLINYYKEQFKL